jgi:hypothetical protein
MRKCLWIIGLVVFVVPAWAGTLDFAGSASPGQGLLSFTPGNGNTLTIGAGNGTNGATVTDLFTSFGLCGGDCTIVSGYATLTSGAETGGSAGGSIFSYTFGSGGTLDIYGGIPSQGISTGSLLFSSSFSSASFTGSGAVGTFSADVDLGSIFLDPSLGAYNFTVGDTTEVSFRITSTCGTGGGCSGPIVLSDTTLIVPEPYGLPLFGIGLLSLAAVANRKSVVLGKWHDQ